MNAQTEWTREEWTKRDVLAAEYCKIAFQEHCRTIFSGSCDVWFGQSPQALLNDVIPECADYGVKMADALLDRLETPPVVGTDAPMATKKE